MVKKVVIPGVDPESSLFNRSCKPYLNLDSRFTVRVAQCPGMTRKGFTLIELLVVVLIIGILAAVALPQYQKAVTKSRAMEAKSLMRTVIMAEESYFLATGTYTNCLNDLDIDVVKGFSVVSETGGCITGVAKGSGAGRIYLEAARNPRDWWFVAWVGSKIWSGSGGYGAYFGSRVRPLSCVEHACHAVREGSFCREIMGIQSTAELVACERIYKE